MTEVEFKERFQSMESTLRSVVQVMEKLLRGKKGEEPQSLSMMEKARLERPTRTSLMGG